MAKRRKNSRQETCLEQLWLDVKRALRALGANRGFTASVVFALALGIGVNVVMFSVVNAVLLNPLILQPFRRPDRLMMIWERNPHLSAMFANHMPPRLETVKRWRQGAHSFESIAVWRPDSAIITEAGSAKKKPESVVTGYVTTNFLPTVGLSLRLGRNFTQLEEQHTIAGAAILSDEFWRSRFGGDPGVLGKSVVADGKPLRVVGVLPANFAIPSDWMGLGENRPKLLLPLKLPETPQKEDNFNNNAIGRLRPGVSLAQAQAELNGIAQRTSRERPDDYTGFGVNAMSLTNEMVDSATRHTLLVMQTAVLFVLLIACANAGNLMLSRAIARDREVAVRTALGATPGRILRETMTESVLLASAGAFCGILLAYWVLRVMSSLAPSDIPGLNELRLDATVLLFAAGLAIFSGLLFGLAPASRSLQRSVTELLGRSGRGFSASSNNLRNALVIAEIALSLVLLAGAGLAFKSLRKLTATDLGFDLKNLFIMRVTLPPNVYPKPEQVRAFNRKLLEGLRGVPGVQAVALTNSLPMKSVSQSSFTIPGKTFPKGTLPVTDWARTSEDYFKALRMPLLRGRAFTTEEVLKPEPDVAVVNDAFAREFFGGDALGKIFEFGGESGKITKYRIIGVVPDEHQMGPDTEKHSEVYLPGQQLQSILVVARMTRDPLKSATAMQQQVWNIDKEQPVAEVGTEEGALYEWLAPRRFNMTVLLNFAAVALVLAAVGLYGVLAYLVSLRTREIGIRMALGAQPKTVAGLVVRQGLRLSVAGVVLGMAGAFALTRFMENLIFGISAVDPLTFSAVAIFLIAVAALASYLPARRASLVNPVDALKAE